MEVFTWQLFIRWLHILGAATWIGGMIFLLTVLAPYFLRTTPNDTDRTEILGAIGKRFSYIGWAALGLLVATGIINAFQRMNALEQLWTTRFGIILSIKLALFLTIIVLSLVHDFVLGPRLVEAAKAARTESAEGRSEGSAFAAYRRLRRQTTFLARLNFILAFLVLFLGVTLTRSPVS